MGSTQKEEHSDPIVAEDSSISTIHLCNGFLGGVGKSTLARLFCERFIKIGRSFTLIDADANYNVARAYDRETVALWQHKDVKSSVGSIGSRFGRSLADKADTDPKVESNLLSEQIIFSKDAKFSYLGDQLLDIIYGLKQDIIVSLPANDGIDFWLDSNNINGLMESGTSPFRVVNWWCSFGSSTSQQMFVDFVTKYPNLHHVCVFNLGITSAVPNWDRFDPLPTLDKLSQDGKVKIANILHWLADPAILEAVDLGTPLHEIVKNGDRQGKQLNPIVKLKIDKWLEDNWQSFMNTGYLL
jgi:hypothetical protein